MKQQKLAGFQRYGKTTRRAQFLAQMDQVVPWLQPPAVVEPHYSTVGDAGGRPPMPLERMLRVYCLRLWFNLRDPAVEEPLYDSAAMCGSASIDLSQEGAPDGSMARRFRYMLERHKPGKKPLSTVIRYLARNGIKIGNGTLVNITLISALSSVKNKDGKREPQMHQATKDKWWYFGMKAHAAVNSRYRLIYPLLVSVANVADCLVLYHLLHGKETCVWGDLACRGQSEVPRLAAPMVRDCANRRYRWSKRSSEQIKTKYRSKSAIPAEFERSVGVIEPIFGFRRGLLCRA